MSSPSRFRDSIAQLPTWPALILAVVVVVGVGIWFYGPTYQRCSELKGAREDLRAAIAAAGRKGTILDFAEAFPGPWDEMRIAQGHRLAPGQRSFDCPFGWDLSRDERRALIASGDYTLIGFFEGGQFRRYIEYRGDWARFDGDVETMPRERARFHVASSSGNPAVLTPAGP